MHTTTPKLEVLAFLILNLHVVINLRTNNLQKFLEKERGIRIYQSLKCDRKINVQWVCVKCPKQPTFFECGYYVMKYIEDIIKDVNILKNNFKGIDNYSMKDLSELCDRWATYVAKLITTYNREVWQCISKNVKSELWLPNVLQVCCSAALLLYCCGCCCINGTVFR